jgi:hypothetical protein
MEGETMKKLIVALLATVAVLPAVPAARADTFCSGGNFQGHSVNGNLIVPKLATCDLVGGVAVSGNAEVGEGATLLLDGSRISGNVYVGKLATFSAVGNASIGGNIDADACVWVRLQGSEVGGNVNIKRCAGFASQAALVSSFQIGGSFVCVDNDAGCNLENSSVTGNVLISRNSEFVSQIVFDIIGGNVTVDHNSGATVAIVANTINGNLRCIGNSLGVSNQKQQNTVEGAERGQCAGPGF